MSWRELRIPETHGGPRSRGSALLVVLWTVAILAVVVYGTIDAGRAELRIARNHARARQAHYLALAGIERAKAEIYQESQDRKIQGESLTSRLHDSPSRFERIRLGAGEYSVLHPDPDALVPGSWKFGVRSEEERLDVNTASFDLLMRLPGMTADVAAAIIDWRDEDGDLHEKGGAEADFYATLPSPYRIANQDLGSIRELLSVRGIDEFFLLGEDHDGDGFLDPSEDDGEESYPPDNRDGFLQGGLARWLTPFSEVENVDAQGRPRIDITSAGVEELVELSEVDEDLARAIIAYREKNEFKNIGQFLDTAPVQEENEDGNRPDGSEGRGEFSSGPPIRFRNQGSSGGGDRLISEAHFKKIADRITVHRERSRRGLVNVNRASLEVLACLPGMTLELAESLVNYRNSRNGFQNIGEVLDVPGMGRETFQGLSNSICVRAGTYRIISEGRIPATGVRRRIEVVVRMGILDFDTIYYREHS